ncbi:MAG TPA: hypothetical protein VNI78_12305 [Vicinamibacterales bacterium]|nr:hypothetical protein [Vicinamibacterales bacterium]
MPALRILAPGRPAVQRAANAPAVVCWGTLARHARPTAAKREREKALLERRQQKAARRQDLKARKALERPRQDGVDPDIAHIKPGPQPPADWQIDDE